MPEETAIAVAEAPSAGAGAAPATSVTGAAPALETGAEPQVTEVPTGEHPTQEAPTTEESSQTGDTRIIPVKWREAFSKDRELRNLFFQHREFSQVFPGGIPEARAFKESYETAGGETGITQLQTDLSDFKTVAQQFMDGDPQFAADLFKENPLEAASHTAEWVKQLRVSDEQSYNRLIARHLAEEFQATGVRALLDRAYQLTENTEAKQLLERMAGWHDAVVQVSKQEDDPRFKKLQEQLKKERSQRASTETQTFMSSYLQEAYNQNTSTANRLLDDYLRSAPANMKPDDSERKLLLKNAIVEADAVLSADKEFGRQRNALVGRRDSKALLRFVTSRWESELKKSVALVMKTFGKGWSKTTPAPAGNGQPPVKTVVPVGFTPVQKRPDGNSIDWEQTSFAMVSQQKKAILKDGKKVTWTA